MIILEQASALMREIVNETKDMSQGTIPSVLTLTSLQARAFDLYWQIGQEEGRMFSGKERAYLERKCAAARHHLHGRRDLGMSAADAREDAIEQTKTEHEAQIAAESMYEDCRLLRASLDRAFAFLAQCIATVKNMENRIPSYQA